ncbi:hypothetical protein AB1Y20_003984 [Prymnesium parvum]|uniref:Lon N-terminal domain-containing protein n=1 Tax=Prymnesium parvum TaxID=97485 RepID=A0AB34J6H6_PRYPA
MPSFLMLLLLLPHLAALPSKPPDYAVLSHRLAALKHDEADVKCLLLDAMVPRQRLQIQFGPPVSDVLRELRRTGDGLAVLGVNHRSGEVLRRGVEARVEAMSPYRASAGYFSSHSLTPLRSFTALDTTLVAGRRLEIVEHGAASWPPDELVFPARVRWLPSDEMAPPSAILLAQSLPPLVDEWLQLVRTTKRERAAGQMSGVLNDLGPISEMETPDDLAFWVAALVNPLPALGVAVEVRAAMLEAADPLYRVQIAQRVLTDSIERMRQRPPGPFEVELSPTKR